MEPCGGIDHEWRPEVGGAPEDLMTTNPRLIVVRVSGYGQTGPYASRPGYGAIGEAIGSALRIRLPICARSC